jgi:tetratricopeptide (TPR) repeat protein
MLIRNNVDKISRAIDSLQSLRPEFLIVNVGSQDGTGELCMRRGIRAYNVGPVEDYSSLRNQLTYQGAYDWQFLLHPWEIISDANAIVEMLQGPPKVFSFPVLNGNVVTYEPRLWHRSLNCKFKNPVFEHLDAEESTLSSIMILGDGRWLPDLKDIHKWKERRPASSEPVYYEACYHLAQNEWSEFLACSTKYLFGNNAASRSVITMKFHTAVVLCHIQKDANKAIKHILECLTVKPLMAEYWCLLGDVFYFLVGNYEKAKQFYLNAITLGSKRQEDDRWPIEFQKYRDYPKKMIGSCDALLECDKMIVQIPR